MTPAELREAAEVMRRAADGEQVQVRFPDSSVWITFNCPTADIAWNWECRVYRIAPKPREVWLNDYPASCAGAGVIDERGGAQ